MYKPLLLTDEIFINQFSQNLHSIEEMNIWFLEKNDGKKREILFGLLNMVIQSHPTYNDIQSAAQSIKKLSSTSAAILLNPNKPYNKFGYKICTLPEKELLTSYDILLLSLAAADNRRKAEESICECNHWWHKDLSDEKYINLLKEHGI